MQCEKCGSALDDKYVSCQKCGAPVPQAIRGFEDVTIKIQCVLRGILQEYGARFLINRAGFVGLLKDFILDCDSERRLLINMYNMGVFKILVAEKKHEISIARTRRFMTEELYLSENAAEFVLACFTYMLGWVYDSPMKVVPAEKEHLKKERVTSVDIDEMTFTPLNAIKFRLSSNVTIPEGYTKLEAFCFDKYSAMKTVRLPKTLISINEYAFSSCKRLKSIDLPEGLRFIKQGAFSQCINLIVVKIPEGVMEIADGTFSFCTSLKMLEIPKSVSSIGAEAFSGCESLRKLFLPESVKFIDANAFSYCPNLVIYCIENTYVHKYCLVYGLHYQLVSQVDAETFC